MSAETAKSLLIQGFEVDASALTIPIESIRYALAVIGALPVLIIFPYIQKFYAKGIMLGSTKG